MQEKRSSMNCTLSAWESFSRRWSPSLTYHCFGVVCSEPFVARSPGKQVTGSIHGDRPRGSCLHGQKVQNPCKTSALEIQRPFLGDF